MDLSELVYFGKFNDASACLANHGWQVTTTTAHDLRADNGLNAIDSDPMREMIYTSATFTGNRPQT